MTENPFPPQATSSEEGATPFTGVEQTTLLTPEIQRADAVANLYYGPAPLDQRRPFDGSKRTSGRLIYLYGPPGSGKTHAIQFLRRRYGPKLRPVDTPPSQMNIYVKCDSTDFLTLFRRIMSQIGLPAMQQLSKTFTTVVSREEFAAQIERTQGKQASASLNLSEMDYATVERLFDQYLLQRRDVEELQEQEIALTTIGRSELKHVLSYLTDSKLGPVARSWLIGDPDILRDDLDRLGVDNVIGTVEMARGVLLALMGLIGRTGTRLGLYIDQGEKLFLDANGSKVDANIGLIHSLAEIAQREGGLLLLASTDAAWKILPAEFKQRFGTAQIEFPPLKYNTARSLILVYLNSTRQEPGEDIGPFSDAALKTLLVSSAGNVRRFLQHCAVAFDYASRRGIAALNESDTNTALRDSHVSVPARPRVIEDVARIATEQGIRLERDGKLQETAVDFLVLGKSGVRGIVQVCEAFFRDELNDAAIKAVDLARAAQRVPAPLILVIVGYADPAVIATLRNVIAQVIVFAPEFFEAEFIAALRSLPPEGALVPAGTEPMALERDLQVSRIKLLQTKEDRATQVTRANQVANRVLTEDWQQQRRAQWRAIRSEWMKEKRSIELEIEKRRQERIQEDLRAMDAGQRKARSAWEREMQLAIGAVTFLFAGLTIAGWFAINVDRYKGIEFTLPIFLAVVLLMGLTYLAGRFGPMYLPDFVGWRPFLEPVASFDELDDLAAATARREIRRGYTGVRNPVMRYVRIMTWDGESIGVDPNLYDVLKYETLRPIRWRASEKLGSQIAKLSEDDFRKELPEWVGLPDAPYVVESMAATGASRTRLAAADLSSRLAVVAALSGLTLDKRYRELPARLAIAWKTAGDSTPTPPLVQAFEEGFNERNWNELYTEFRPLGVQNALDELSPMVAPGLGTYDRLKCLGDITRLYLFFRQWQFLLDNDFVPSGEEESDTTGILP